MLKKAISSGVVHQIPADLREALTSDPQALKVWEDLTPLARNEWVCWVTFVKKDETRKEHIKRTISELKEGMRRPCCWLGWDDDFTTEEIARVASVKPPLAGDILHNMQCVEREGEKRGAIYFKNFDGRINPEQCAGCPLIDKCVIYNARTPKPASQT